MFRPLVRSHRRPPRRGTAILITCFFLITIMMVTGLALVMYAAREKAAALAYQEAGATPERVSPAPEGTVNAFLSALIYDVGNGDLANGATVDPSSTALQNSMRGHSIGRAMYGSRADFTTPGNPWGGTTTPWNGVGLFHEVADTYGNSAMNGQDRAQFVNYTLQVLRTNPSDPTTGKPVLLDPEWTGARSIPTSGAVPAFGNSRGSSSYVGKNAGYTYPDLKSFFLGARDPFTGEVIQPSFHRSWLFGSLAPTNLNWTNQIGKMLTLRPRPAEHPNFPRVAPDADGEYRGDVQNLPGGYYYDSTNKKFFAKNDSLWMHIGLPPITLPDGRVVQPMVAPLILPLDGLFDLSIHGNGLNTVVTPPVLPATTPTTSYLHTSYGGYGPWEVNIQPGLAPAPAIPARSEREVLLSWRIPSRAAAFAPFTSPLPQPPSVPQLLPNYAPVAWNNPSTAAFTLPDPTSNSMSGLPAWTGFDSSNTAYSPHPAGYDPNSFGPRSNTGNSLSPVYPYSDLKRFQVRYAFTPDWYNQAFAAKDAPSTFTASGYTANPAANTQSSYRRNSAFTRHGLFTPRAMGLDRPALSPNFRDRGDGTALQITAGATKPGALFPTAGTPYPSPQIPGAISDFASGTQWYNVLTELGSVDLNRPLADYRNDTTKALGTDTSATGGHPANAGNALQAEADRQALAKDIFARLIIATGAAAKVSFDSTKGVQIALPDPTSMPQTYQIPGVPTPATLAQYNALRYLAQLAVNIVDDIDNDDVSTAFQWNSTNPNDLPTGRAADITQATNRVVFGVEKPRLVINEAYGEIANDPEAMLLPNMPLVSPKAHFRFWAELVNPTQTPHTAATGVLGDGSVSLNAYQVLISRANRVNNNYLPNNLAPAGAPPATVGDAAGPLTDLTNPGFAGNVLGVFDTTTTGRPDATFNMAAVNTKVKPNLGQYAPAAPLPNNGFVLLRTNPLKNGSTATVRVHEFNPSPSAAGSVWADAVTSAAPEELNSLGYTTNMPGPKELANPEFRRHVVLLQRLANPYLQASGTNPYVTVDMMDYVPAFDAVIRADMDVADRTERPATGAANDGKQYDPVNNDTLTVNRFSVGKVQPLAGYSYATVDPQTTYNPGSYNKYQFNSAMAPAQNSMVLNQTKPGAAKEPMHTFGVHNGTGAAPAATTVAITANAEATLIANQTIMLPFDWQPHLDRPLETQGDLFTVRDCKPYQLTPGFVLNTTAGLVYNSSYAQWTRHNNGLARALELLTVKSPHLSVAHGGRVGGRINANVLQDSRVALGLWDPQASNRFDQTFVNNTVWGQWINSRSLLQTKYGADVSTTVQSPVPNYRRDLTGNLLPAPTALETLDATVVGDRVFLPYGAPAVAPPASGNTTNGVFAYTNPQAINEGDTFLRRPAPTSAVPNPEPYLILDPVANTTVARNWYTQTEPLRKVMNNLTTVSHAFAVYLTIGYFEVKELAPTDPAYPVGYPTNVNVKNGQAVVSQFGAEVYNDIPGDMRQKYMVVIDMSNMALDPVSPAPASGQPFFTALATTARAGANATLSFMCDGDNSQPASGPNPAVPATKLFIKADGQTLEIDPSNSNTIQLVLGYGSEAQRVTVSGVIGWNPTTRIGQVTVTNLPRDAWGGTCVSNVRPGYIGPQPLFNYTLSAYKPVVPYVERLK